MNPMSQQGNQTGFPSGHSHLRMDRRSNSKSSSSHKELAFFGKMLHQRHYISGTDGNLSVRMASGQILITPGGICKAFLNSRDMVVVDTDGNKVCGSCEASSEIGMHLAIYRLRPDVRGIVHAHPCTATALASAGIDLTEPICTELVLTLGRIPLAPYAPPGSSELARALTPYIKDHDAILLENHGVVTYGNTLERAYLNMESVEHCARIVLVTRLLGRSRILNEDEVTCLLSSKRPRK